MTNNIKDNAKHKNHKSGDKRMLVSYGKMKQLIWVSHNLTDIPKTSTHVIMKTDRGLEIGKIVGLVVYKSGQFRWDENRVSSYYEEQNPGEVVADDGELIRIANHEDVSEWRHLKASTKSEIEICQKIVKEMLLEMKIVEAEHIFGGERIIFYFTADGRIDFRELVKRLAKEFQTRIEMRQIGARDEAMILCDFESCGQECCCARYLKVLKPVNMRMAKLQKATLDPSKISGYCGRLKCCLRYEDDTYKHLKKKLPNRGTWVKCDEGTGQIVDSHVITQLVVVQGADGKRFAVGVDEIEIIDRPDINKKNEEKKADQVKANINDSDHKQKAETIAQVNNNNNNGSTADASDAQESNRQSKETGDNTTQKKDSRPDNKRNKRNRSKRKRKNRGNKNKTNQQQGKSE